MSFKNLVVAYILYYLFVIVYDLYFANRNSENEDKGEDIDISDSLGKYVPADASKIAKKEAGEEEKQKDEQGKDTIEVNHCGGMTPGELREIFADNTGESFFLGIIPTTT